MLSKSVADRVAELGSQVNNFLIDKVREYKPDLTNMTVDQALEQDIAVSILTLELLIAAQKKTAADMGIDYIKALP